MSAFMVSPAIPHAETVLTDLLAIQEVVFVVKVVLNTGEVPCVTVMPIRI